MVDTVEPTISLGLTVHASLQTTALPLVQMIVVASHIAKQVHLPSANLLSEQLDQGGDWRIFGQLMQLMQKVTFS